MFDDDHLVSCAGLVPVMALAEQTVLLRLLDQKVDIKVPRTAAGVANPAPKLAAVVAGMCAGADCIDDVDALRSGGMKTLFGAVYAPSTIGTLLREFTFGHARQLESVLREHLVALCERVDLLPGADQRVFIDIDSLLRPVMAHKPRRTASSFRRCGPRRHHRYSPHPHTSPRSGWPASVQGWPPRT